MRIAGPILLISLVAAAVGGAGLVRAWQQWKRIQTYHPQAATIKSAELSSTNLGRYVPRIHYEYTVQGRTYESDRLAPLGLSGPKDWAKPIVARYSSGGATVYVDRADPASSFLLREGRFYPYGLMLAAVAILSVGLQLILTGGFFEPAPNPTQTSKSGWYRLARSAGPSEIAMTLAGITVGWYLSGLIICGHYFLVLGTPYERLSVLSVLYGLLGISPLVKLIRTLPLVGRFREPQLLSTLPVSRLDQPVIVRLGLPVSRTVVVGEVRVSLDCYRRCGMGSQRIFTTSATVAHNQTLNGGEVLYEEFSFEVPNKKRRASSRFSRWDYPRIDWTIELAVKLKTGRIYRVHFPLKATVAPAHRAGAAA